MNDRGSAAPPPADRPNLVTVDALWTGDGFAGPTALSIGDGILHAITADRAAHAVGRGASPVDPERIDAPGVLHLGGTLIPSLTDHHTHLGLSDPAALFRGGITHAVDLGWIPAVAAGWLPDRPDRPAIAIAGALLTAPGGYPVTAGWAPPGASKEVGGPREAVNAVQEQVMTGASRIKVALNSDAGETVDDATLRAIVEESHATGLPVVAHAQGAGQAARAVRAGVDQLAHTPFSERLDDSLLAEAAEARMSWISTLDIHGWGTYTASFRFAVDNLRRFAARGGRVLYGTDLGNGDLPVGVNARELAAIRQAGLDGPALIRTIAGSPIHADADSASASAAGATVALGPRIAWIPSVPPADPGRLPGWLATARGLFVSDLASPAPAPATQTAMRTGTAATNTAAAPTDRTTLRQEHP